jgi:hypothetical protein
VFERATLAMIAKTRCVEPADLFFDLALEDDLETTFTAKLM